jgi:caffeoyl-CoA O-methyltransferase
MPGQGNKGQKGTRTMKKKPGWGRREFLKTTGRTLGYATLAAQIHPGFAGASPVDLPPIQRNPEKLRRLLDQMEKKGYQYWSVPRRDGEFLHFMVKACGAKNILEIGTSQGFSAIWMGLALEETGGRLTTIEISRDRYEQARRNVREAGLAERVRLILGDAHTEVTQLAGPFDFIFSDADKEGQMDYFQKLYPRKLAPGGILAVHNAIRQEESMKDYLALIRKHGDFDTVTLSVTMDDGFCLSYRHRGRGSRG